MPFWIVAALLTLLACLAVLLPLTRRKADEAGSTGFDVAVYQDQLAELERDLARGAINPAEAAEARAEIGRRILRLSGTEVKASEGSGGRAGRVIATLAVLAVPVASWSIYAATGSPHLPAQPLQARLDSNPAENSVFELVARAERHLDANPEDGRGWEVLAPIYSRIGRHADAANAHAQAIRLLGSTAAREVAHGEALTAADGGAITSQANAAFERALALEPRNPKARFLVAAALAQQGRREEAVVAFSAILGDLPEASPWRPAIAQAIAELSGEAQPDSAAPGPSAEEIEAAGLISDNDRAEMIGEMVAGLDRRLRENPDDPEGWQRLVRAYVVLAKPEEAADALARGIDALGRGSAAAVELQAFAAGFGVEEKE